MCGQLAGGKPDALQSHTGVEEAPDEEEHQQEEDKQGGQEVEDYLPPGQVTCKTGREGEMLC